MWVKMTLLGCVVGTFGTTLGGLLAVKRPSRRFCAMMMGLAAGVMAVLIVSDLLPESWKIQPAMCVLGALIGITFMVLLQTMLKVMLPNVSSLYYVGILMFFGVAAHNFFEGVAVGASLAFSMSAGVSISLAILLHDIPEGLAIAMPLRHEGQGFWRIVLYCVISGLPTGLGTAAGYFAGKYSLRMTGLSLAFAAGAMVYVVWELVHESRKISGKATGAGCLLGLGLAGLLFFHVI